MERIIRIFVVGSKGERQTLAFDMSRFVAYNVDTHLLTLTNLSIPVHQDSEERLIKAYRLLDEDEKTDEYVMKSELDDESKD